MTVKLSAVMICLNEKDFIGAALESLVGVVDEVVIVDGGSTDGTIEEIYRHYDVPKTVLSRQWSDDYGAQRQYGIDHAKGTHVLILDSDEVLSDNAVEIKDWIEKEPETVWDLSYVHYIRDLGHVDATLKEHVGIFRVFPNKGVYYDRKMHEVPRSEQWVGEHKIMPDVFVHHLGYVKSIASIPLKFEKNLKSSPIHSKEFLVQWRDWHVFGTFPVRAYDKAEFGDYPEPLKELFKL